MPCLKCRKSTFDLIYLDYPRQRKDRLQHSGRHVWRNRPSPRAARTARPLIGQRFIQGQRNRILPRLCRAMSRAKQILSAVVPLLHTWPRTPPREAREARASLGVSMRRSLVPAPRACGHPFCDEWSIDRLVEAHDLRNRPSSVARSRAPLKWNEALLACPGSRRGDCWIQSRKPEDQ